MADASVRPVFRVADGRIDEASGIARGIRNPGIVYVQNDSGDTNRVFALDARTGATVAVLTIAGARNVDWEDLAIAPDAAGVPSLWIADTGDNDADRGEVQLYRVDEPRLDARERGRSLTTAAADVWRLRYPGGPTDAESLAVTPRGVAYLVTKSYDGTSTVYRVPAGPDPQRVQAAARIGRITFTPTGTSNPFGILGQLAATGAAISRDGTLLAVRTYADAWLWPLRAGDVASAIRRTGVRVALPGQRQGEGIAIDGSRLLLDSEGEDQPVYAVPVPATARPASAPSTSHSAAQGSGTQQPGTQQSGTQQSGTQQPGTQQPAAQGSGTQQPGTQQPGTQQSGTAFRRPTSPAACVDGGGGGGLNVGATIVFALALAIIGGVCGRNRIRVRRTRRGR